MADDDLLVNFSVGSETLQAQPVFKGGRWKDRLQAKKSSQRWRDKLQSNGTLTGSNAVPTKIREPTIEDQNSRPVKKQKLNGTSYTTSKSHNTTSKPKEVISSLFTFNATAKPKDPAQAQAEDAPPPEPSNAPLPASASPFLSLGLFPFLSTHLSQSLNLTAPTAIQKSAVTQLLRENSDAFIQAETGSGKTLAYLLPIVQKIMALSTETSKIRRTSGLFALILAPTRELTHQISGVLTRLLRPLPHLVAGTVTGGSTKNHEKSRLRKGLNILIATPGRLKDHLEHTEVLDVGDVRWLVLDEGDRLMELGFEEDIKAILRKLDVRKSETKGDRIRKNSMEGLPNRRTTVLCSATMQMGVQRLGEISLKDAIHIRPDPTTASSPVDTTKEDTLDEKENSFVAPAQLRQSCVITPPKQRLVTLAALLKHTFARKGSVMKAIVFLSCADSVDFHFSVFARKEKQAPKGSTKSEQNIKINAPRQGNTLPTATEASSESAAKQELVDLPTVALASNLASKLNPNLTLFQLHGSLEQKLRTATLKSFTKCSDPAILLCTDVASRGLDLPNIDLVIEYDPPFSTNDHLHRVGRTARAGKEGRACCFLMPGEEEGYVSILKACAGGAHVKTEGAEEALRKGFARNKSTVDASAKWDEQATEWQLEIERWVLDDRRAGDLARKAFISHVRAYATHIAKERAMFDVKALHLGHLAKAFALRERPGNMGRGTATVKARSSRVGGQGEKRRSVAENHVPEDDENNERRPGKADIDMPASDGRDAARKMRATMKEHMAGANEFNIG